MYQVHRGQERPGVLFAVVFYFFISLAVCLVITTFTASLPTDPENYQFGGLSVSWTWNSTDPDLHNELIWQSFNWHPILMVMAFAFFFPQAAVAYKLLPFSHDVNKLFHGACQFIAFLLSTTAIVNAFVFKKYSGNTNLYTAHSWLGFTAYLAFSLQFLGGFISYGIPNLMPLSMKKMIMPWHVFAGFGIFFLTTAAICSGIADRQVLCCFPSEPRSAAYVVSNLLMLTVIMIAALVFWVHRPRKFHPSTEAEHRPLAAQKIVNYNVEPTEQVRAYDRHPDDDYEDDVYE